MSDLAAGSSTEIKREIGMWSDTSDSKHQAPSERKQKENRDSEARTIEQRASRARAARAAIGYGYHTAVGRAKAHIHAPRRINRPIRAHSAGPHGT